MSSRPYSLRTLWFYNAGLNDMRVWECGYRQRALLVWWHALPFLLRMRLNSSLIHFRCLWVRIMIVYVHTTSCTPGQSYDCMYTRLVGVIIVWYTRLITVMIVWYTRLVRVMIVWYTRLVRVMVVYKLGLGHDCIHYVCMSYVCMAYMLRESYDCVHSWSELWLYARLLTIMIVYTLGQSYDRDAWSEFWLYTCLVRVMIVLYRPTC